MNNDKWRFFLHFSLLNDFIFNGAHQSIISNCNLRVAYTPNNFETAKHLSQLIGCTTIMVSNSSYSGNRFGMFLQNIHKDDYDIKRSLFTPDEIMRLPSVKAIIMKTGLAPVLGKKLTYYTDDILLSRSTMLPIYQQYQTPECAWNLYSNKPDKTNVLTKESSNTIFEVDVLT